jgi:peptidylprolyl isomerase
MSKRTSVAVLGILFAAGALLAQGKFASTASGLKMKDLKVGTGTLAKQGSKVQVHYTGWLFEKGARGKKFDSSLDRHKPFVFTIGEGRVIKGWEQGVKGMKEGGKRELIIPPDLAYGSRGFPGAVPPNSMLDFEIELLRVAK